MSIQIAFHQERSIPAAAILSLYNQKPNPVNRPIEDIETVLRVGGPAVGVWANQQLIGFARAVTDGHFRAYIEEVLVDKRYPQSSIGQKMISYLLKGLRQVETVHLLCSPEMFERRFDSHKNLGLWLHQQKKANDLSSPA
ncbi:GNAT family N-acetyltransferase [Laceyella putida]|jgi:hypothetical protein|uniref:GNAT family N-acetyltransferase n=1 Tax=Laceyella putida TaxID=110101 RepID=A0ABW2RN32_9BACL